MTFNKYSTRDMQTTTIPALEFLAEALVHHLRSGAVPTEEEADLMNRLPIIDCLRDRAKRPDVDGWLMPAVSNQEGECAGLCLSLLRKFDTDPATCDSLKQRWSTASSFLKAHLLWRILDDPDLPQEWHQRIVDFILREQEAFHAASLKFLGPPERAAEIARKRFHDPKFPTSKKWSYLCRVVGTACDAQEARRFLQDSLRDPDPFTQRVASLLLERFYPSR